MFELIFPTGYVQNVNVGNIDVIVNTSTGKSYTGTIFSLENIKYLMSLPENSKYFWVADMVVVHNLEIETIEDCIRTMIEENVLSRAFEEILQN